MSGSLETLVQDGIIDGVLGLLKTGKEAEVWLVQHAGEIVAAKLYKERHARNFRNNAGYREGREVRNSRTRRAMEKGSRFGQAAAEEAWKSAEADTLHALHAAGVRVPTPVMFYEGVLLMEVVVDPEGHPAPRLVEHPPATPDEAHAMYLDLRAQVVRMLSADLIHGDLSAYNILRGWNGPTIIDFPQSVAAARNNSAERYFRRDFENVRGFLEGVDPRLAANAGDVDEVWSAYVRRELTPDFVPSGRGARMSRRAGPPGRGRGGERGGAAHPRPGPTGPHAPAHPAGHREAGHREPGFGALQGAAPDAGRPPHPAAPADLTPADALEAELRELEAQVLRQGGGERGRPPAAAPRGQRDRRSGSPGRGGARPGGPLPRREPGGGGPRPGAAPAARAQGGPESPRPGGAPPPRREQGAGGQHPRGGPPGRVSGPGAPRPGGAPSPRPQGPTGAPRDAVERRLARPESRERREGRPSPYERREGPQGRREPRGPTGREPGGRGGPQARLEGGRPPGSPPVRGGPPRGDTKPARRGPEVSFVARPERAPVDPRGGPGPGRAPAGEHPRAPPAQGRTGGPEDGPPHRGPH